MVGGSGGSLTVDLGTDIVTGEIVNNTILAVDLSTTTTFLDGELITYVSATDNFTSLTCAEITGDAGLCDSSDDGVFSWTVDSGIGGVATSTTLGFFNGFVSTASSTALGGLTIDNSTTTNATDNPRNVSVLSDVTGARSCQLRELLHMIAADKTRKVCPKLACATESVVG